MNTPQQANLLITYTDGKQDHFQFPYQLEQASMAGMIEKILSASTLTLQLSDRLMVIPTSGIRTAELFPVPDRLPIATLYHVKRL